MILYKKVVPRSVSAIEAACFLGALLHVEGHTRHVHHARPTGGCRIGSRRPRVDRGGPALAVPDQRHDGFRGARVPHAHVSHTGVRARRQYFVEVGVRHAVHGVVATGDGDRAELFRAPIRVEPRRHACVLTCERHDRHPRREARGTHPGGAGRCGHRAHRGAAVGGRVVLGRRDRAVRRVGRGVARGRDRVGGRVRDVGGAGVGQDRGTVLGGGDLVGHGGVGRGPDLAAVRAGVGVGGAAAHQCREGADEQEGTRRLDREGIPREHVGTSCRFSVSGLWATGE